MLLFVYLLAIKHFQSDYMVKVKQNAVKIINFYTQVNNKLPINQ